MEKQFNVEFTIDGVGCGSGFITFLKDGTFDTSDAEEMFYKMIRKCEPSMKEEAIEEFKSKIIDGLTDKQEELLKAEHAENYHGQDDDMIDDYENWLMELDYDQLLEILNEEN